MNQVSENRWAQALVSSSNMEEMQRAVLAAVMQINPNVVPGANNDVDSATEKLKKSLQPSCGGVNYTSGKFKRVFSDMLTSLEGDLCEELQAIDEQRRRLDEQSQEIRDSFRDRIISFLVYVQPGQLSESSREVLRQHRNFTQNLNTKIRDLNILVSEKSDEYHFPVENA